MKIYIIGLPGSGKSTVAKELSLKYSIPHVDLDEIFIKHEPQRKRIRRYYQDCEQEILSAIKQPQWIIEGIYPVESIAQQADIIMLLKPPLLTCLYRQWKRYVTDDKQRQRHGIKNNLKLSGFIYLLHTNQKGVKVYRDSPRTKITPFINSYLYKLVTISKPSQLKDWINTLDQNLPRVTSKAQ